MPTPSVAICVFMLLFHLQEKYIKNVITLQFFVNKRTQLKEMEYGQKLKFNEKNWESSRSDEELTLEASAFQSLYGNQFTLSTQLIKPTYLVYIAR